MINEREVWALYSLLDDPSPVVQEQIHRRFIELGEEVVAELRRITQAHGDLHAAAVGEVVNGIRMSTATERLRGLAIHSRSMTMLEEAVFIIARYGYPDADVQAYRDRLDEMAGDIRALSGGSATPVDRIMRMRGYLFSDLGFTGNRRHYYDPDNSYLNRVMDLRRGIPLTLSVLMLLLGYRLNVPVFGIGLPMHFLVHYDDGSRSFLLDPFNGGTVITRQECETMVSADGKPLPPTAYLPVTNRDMIERMLRNLYVANQQNGEHDEAGRIGRLIGVINPEFRVNTSPESDSDAGDMDLDDDT